MKKAGAETKKAGAKIKKAGAELNYSEEKIIFAKFSTPSSTRKTFTASR